MNSIKNVPSRVLSRRSGHGLEAEREQFDRNQATSIGKAINAQEAPVKEKHARRIILGTHHEKGAFTFWSYAIGLPLPSSSILSWKFCHVLHKVLRDGHQNVLSDCQRYRSNIREIGDLWGHLNDRYGQLVTLYTKLLLYKISFHKKHPEFPPNLEVTDDVLEKAAGTDVNNIFQLTVEMFDYMDCELKLAEAVIRQLNSAIAVSQMSAGQCKLAPLIQVIQDSSHLYHYTVKLMFKLHSCLPPDTLQGHRDRFHEQFHSLKNFFKRASDMLYFKRLIQIPRLPDNPPNFLRASAIEEHVKPVVVMANEVPEEEEPPQTESLIEITNAQPVEQEVVEDIFQQTFGPPNGLMIDDRDLQIENLKKEIELLRSELEKMKLEAQKYIMQLKGQINTLEAEVEEQRKQKQKALVDNEQLRDELERLRKQKQESDKSQGLYSEMEKKVQATDVRYNKLKEKHSELINVHAGLLRKNADTAKQLTVSQQNQEEVARIKEQLEFQMDQVKRESEIKLEEQTFQLEQLKTEVESRKEALTRIQESLGNSQQSESHLTSKLAALETEKDALQSLLTSKESELLSVKNVAQETETLFNQEQEKRSSEIRDLHEKLDKKTVDEQKLYQKMLEDQFNIIQGTVKEAENIIQDAVAKLDDPLHIRCTSSPDYLMNRSQAALDSLSSLENGHAKYVQNMTDASDLVGALAQFAHLTADTIVNGSATSHLAPPDQGDRLSDSCRECGSQSLQYLRELKDKQSLKEADLGEVRRTLQNILGLGEELRPKSFDIRQEELGDMVDKEMASTSAAIEDAVRRIEEMMNQARKDTSGVKLEVNERILISCTDLMKAIRQLVLTSTDLQKEIVESGKGAATIQEFYARNSRWTEGLISASKAVGWGATQLVESADKVVLHKGKYEELIVGSHEIAASTAQLVAASKVKADRNSKNLPKLQQCSRRVNEMAANVVASTKSGQEQIEEKDTMDFSGMSLIKLKKEEMETQVKVLELENMLQNERIRLGELRRKHYALAGAYDEADEAVKSAQKPGILKKPQLPQKPNIPPKGDHKIDKDDGVYQANLINF
ncbi:PREDICTED: huntingtin-interacting protein 1-related protein isoform X1 [Nanorana parkeri]|uniref:huntingtin-interacting protein 1-related protein isoform X1 n=1 Tax=Nanorana parkeri TaxID=125878 RepID=UPI0008543E7D|nr:PREDICTED: huntingtin-interacting protein 1-related protein isoform X1 [Nanorana parkeri]